MTRLPEPDRLADVPPLATARTLLRPVAAADLPALLAVNGDPEVTRFLPYAPWRSLDDAQAWLGRVERSVAAGDARQLVLCRRDDGRPVGTVLLFRHDAGSARAELGYVLGRAAWGQGLMTEALHALLAFAFAAGGLRRLEAEVDTRNAASNALLQRLGFGHEGTARGRWVNHGQPCDMHRYGLLRADWPAAGRAPD